MNTHNNLEQKNTAYIWRPWAGPSESSSSCSWSTRADWASAAAAEYSCSIQWFAHSAAAAATEGCPKWPRATL